MQAKEEMGIVCPHCGRVQKVTRWHLVNLESEPLAKLRAFKGTLFKVPCEACGKTMQFHYPCIFLDETHRALLYLCPEEVEQDTQTLSALPPQEGYKLRLVRTPEELAEKLQILECGLEAVSYTHLYHEVGYAKNLRPFLEDCSLGYTLDVKQAAQSGYPMEGYLEEMGDRLCNLHLCDITEQEGMVYTSCLLYTSRCV